MRAHARRPTREYRARDALSCSLLSLSLALTCSLPLSRMRKTIFGIQAASRVYALEEKRWIVGITRAIREYVW